MLQDGVKLDRSNAAQHSFQPTFLPLGGYTARKAKFGSVLTKVRCQSVPAGETPVGWDAWLVGRWNLKVDSCLHKKSRSDLENPSDFCVVGDLPILGRGRSGPGDWEHLPDLDRRYLSTGQQWLRPGWRARGDLRYKH